MVNGFTIATFLVITLTCDGKEQSKDIGCFKETDFFVLLGYIGRRETLDEMGYSYYGEEQTNL